jgi:hypothetical protein
MKEVRNVLGLWPDYATIATDCRVTEDAVWQWRKRSRIPHKQHLNLANSAKQRGIQNVSLESLAVLSQPKQKNSPKSGLQSRQGHV